MNLKIAKITVQSIGSAKTEWGNALKGKIHSIQPNEALVFTSFAQVGKAFSSRKVELLKMILMKKPATVQALAMLVDRDVKTVFSDSKFLSNLELIKWKSNAKKNALSRPVAKYSGFVVDLFSK